MISTQVLCNSLYSSRSPVSYPRYEPSSVIVSCSKSDNVSYKFKLEEEKSDKVPSFPTKLRLDFACLRDLGDAVAMFEEMTRMPRRPSVVEFNKLLNSMVRIKQFSAALHLFDLLLQWDAPLDIYSFTAAIDCFCRLKRADLGFAVLGSIFKHGYEPSVVTFNNLIKGLLLVGKVSEAGELFNNMSREGVCEPNEYTRNIYINGLCKAGHTLRALELLKLFEKERCKLDVRVFNIVLDNLCKIGMVDDALSLFSAMLCKGILPNVITFNAMIRIVCSFSRWREFEDVLNPMVAPNISLDGQRSDTKEGERVLDIMEQINVQPDIFTYTTLIDGYGSRGEMEKARRIFDLAVNSGLELNVVCYNSLINGYVKKRWINDAWSLFLAIPTEIEKTVFSYSIMLQGLFRAGRCDDGLKLFKEMQARNLSPNVVTYSSLLDGLCRGGRSAEAFSFLQRMEDEGVVPSIVTYTILIDGLCKVGEIERAKDLFEQLPSKGLQPNVVTYNILIGGVCEDGKIEEAKDLMVKMVDRGCLPNSVTYNVYVRGLMRRKQMEEAVAMLEEMITKGFKLDKATFDLAKKLYASMSDRSSEA